MIKYILYCFTLIFILLLLIACNSKQDSKYKEILSISLVKDKEVEFPIKYSNLDHASYIAKDNQSGIEYWIDVNIQKQLILFYDLKSGQLNKALKIPNEFIPNGVFYINSDSIYISEHWGNRILLTDFNAKINNVWSAYEKDSIPITFFATSYQPFIVTPKCIISEASAGEGNILEGFYNYPPIYSFDKISNNSNLKVNRAIPYSEKFKTDTVWYISNASFAVKNDNIYVSFANDHNIYYYDDKEVQTISAKSKYLDKFLPFDRERAFKTSYIDSLYRVSPYYEGLIYDKYRDLFYRIAVHQAPISPDGENITEVLDKTFSIICMDKNFRIIDEIVMPNKMYYYSSIYVYSDGILLPYISEDKSKLKLQKYRIIIKYKD